MNVGIVSTDSDIGHGVFLIHKDRGDQLAITTRREFIMEKARKHVIQHLELTDRKCWQPFPQVDRLYFTIGTTDTNVFKRDVMMVNAVLPVEWLETQVQYMKPGCQVVVMSSQFGSIARAINARALTYRMSKAALNMGVRGLKLRFPHINFCLYHPGIVKTKMLGDQWKTFNFPALEILDAALACVQRIDSWNNEFGFLSYDGTTIDW